MSIRRINRGNSLQRITGEATGKSIIVTPSPATLLGNNLYEYVFSSTNSITFSNQVNPFFNIQYTPNQQSRYIRTTTSSSNVSILVVGGGGGTLAPVSASPSGYGGGGGAGGVAYLTSGTIQPPQFNDQVYTVTVGGGGPGNPSTDSATYLPTTKGTNSSFVGNNFNIQSGGGGGGSTAGAPGGSGGGASYPEATPVGQGTQPLQSQIAPDSVTNYGNPGGPTFPFTSFPSGCHDSSGGGGAGTPGLFPGSCGAGGNGGNGVTLFGRTVGGGGGGRGTTNGSGGPGGGGNCFVNGTANTGGGGGGGNAAGGSGLIVVRIQY